MNICAIMAIYNEADVVVESVLKLFEAGIQVYIIDNGSKDDSIEKLLKYCSHAIIDIETLVSKETDKEIYNWGLILDRKAELSKALNYDWFMHVDADEIRYSPWHDLSLSDAIRRVDSFGYNLIDFKLFNFRLTNETEFINDEIESSLLYYSKIEKFNSMQVKVWKKSPHIDLKSSGGHLARVDNPKIFPIKFIHKHYPLRSIEHAKRKILIERHARISKEEMAKKWHIQYNSVDLSTLEGVIWDKNQLTKFDYLIEANRVLFESLEGLIQNTDLISQSSDDNFLILLQNHLQRHYGITDEDSLKFYELGIQLIKALLSNQFPTLNISQPQKDILIYVTKIIGHKLFYNGNPEVLNKIQEFFNLN